MGAAAPTDFGREGYSRQRGPGARGGETPKNAMRLNF